jgi:hypothetical protein
MSTEVIRLRQRRFKTFAIAVLMLLYAFAAGWLFTHFFPTGAFHFSSPLVPVQTIEGFLNGVLFGIFFPLTVLTLPIIVLALMRVPYTWVSGYLAVALVTCTIAATIASTGPRYLSPFWGVVLSVLFSIVPLTLWTVLLTSIVRRFDKS